MSSDHEWQVHDLSLYNTFLMEDTEDMGLSVSLLIPLDIHHKSNGGFRLALYGGHDMNVSIPASGVFPSLPPPIADTSLNFPCSAARNMIPENCTAAPWRSVETMIRHNQ